MNPEKYPATERAEIRELVFVNAGRYDCQRARYPQAWPLQTKGAD
jgi:hypothetical protein